MKILALFLLLSATVLGQIDLSYTRVTTISGVSSPNIVDGILFGGEDSTPTPSRGAIIRTKTRMKFTEIEVTRNDEDIDAKKFNEATVQIVAATDTTPEVTETTTSWLIVGEGTYRIIARGYDPTLGIAKQRLTIVLGKPTPTPTPVPPKPDDPLPEPVKSFRVIFVKESGSTLPSEQTAITGSKAVRDYLSAKTTPDGSLSGWREYDPQQNTSNEQPTLKSLWAAAKSSITAVPCIVVEVNGKVSILPYPKNTAEALKTLKDIGGQ